MDDDTDPFACFDDDDDESDGGEGSTNIDSGGQCFSDYIATSSSNPNEKSNANNPSKRDPECGILTFHAGTEQALLMHVKQKLSQENRNDQQHENNYSGDNFSAQKVLNAIDEFCLKRHWMMHVGTQKGKIVQSFLQECCRYSARASEGVHLPQTINILELGTYCGYSSILLAKILSDIGGYHGDIKHSFSFYTVEVVEQNARVARRLIQLAGFENLIHVLSFDPFKESLTSFLKREMFAPLSNTDRRNDGGDCHKADKMNTWAAIDFLFIDHDKSLYLPDLQELEQSGWIKQNTFVAADNVIFAQINDYREYMSKLQKAGIVQTRLEESWLEYCDPDLDPDESKNKVFRDGIELTVYLKDPLGHS